MPQPQQQNRVISRQSWSMREKPAVSGPLNSTALVLCQDTASDGPGVNGRRAEDPHGGESASVAGGRKEGVRESTWGSRAFSHTCRAVRALSEARQSRGLTPRARSPPEGPEAGRRNLLKTGKTFSLDLSLAPSRVPFRLNMLRQQRVKAAQPGGSEGQSHIKPGPCPPPHSLRTWQYQRLFDRQGTDIQSLPDCTLSNQTRMAYRQKGGPSSPCIFDSSLVLCVF